jgi:hypothetical protein
VRGGNGASADAPRREELRPDLPTHRVFLLIERAPFGLRDVATIEARHHPLFDADGMILSMQSLRLPRRDPAAGHAFLDMDVLHGKAAARLDTARVIGLPRVSADAAVADMPTVANALAIIETLVMRFVASSSRPGTERCTREHR